MQVKHSTPSKTIQAFLEGMDEFYKNYPHMRSILETQQVQEPKIEIPMRWRRIFKTRPVVQPPQEPAVEPMTDTKDAHLDNTMSPPNPGQAGVDYPSHMVGGTGDHVFVWKDKVYIVSEKDADEATVKKVVAFDFNEFCKVATDVHVQEPSKTASVEEKTKASQREDLKKAYQEATQAFTGIEDPLQEDVLFGRDRKSRRQSRSRKRGQ